MTAADFKAAMPAFASTPDPDIERHIARSVSYFDVGKWGDLLTDGRNFWIAHELVTEAALGATAATAGGSTSLITEIQVGTERIRYSDEAVKAAAKDPFQQTGYGKKYLELAAIAGRGAVAV